MKAVVDRISEEYVVLLIGDEEKEHLVSRKQLPHVTEGNEIEFEWEGTEIKILKISPRSSRSQLISEKLKQLQANKKSNYFKRSE